MDYGDWLDGDRVRERPVTQGLPELRFDGSSWREYMRQQELEAAASKAAEKAARTAALAAADLALVGADGYAGLNALSEATKKILKLAGEEPATFKGNAQEVRKQEKALRKQGGHDRLMELALQSLREQVLGYRATVIRVHGEECRAITSINKVLDLF